MDILEGFMTVFPYVFHPITVLGMGTLLLIRYEWAFQDRNRSALWRRVGVFLGAGLASLLPVAAFMLVTGSGVMETTKGNAWEVDALVAGGLFITSLVTWLVWRRYDWGQLVPTAMQALLVVTIPYALLSPFWNVSGHVITALMPTLYLTLVDRKYWPLLIIPVVMVPNRIYLDAHTWAQVIGAFVITMVVVLPVYWFANNRSLRPAVTTSLT